MTNYLSWSKLTFILISSYILTGYIILEKLHNQSNQHAQDYFGKKSLLVIAHPDDETMFFGPTIMNIINVNKSLDILCLSNGDGENFEGNKRFDELSRVVKAFGPNVRFNVIKDKQLKDSMTIQWNTNTIISYIKAELSSHKDEPINTLITFDSYGVSGHSNHRSIHKAIEILTDKNHFKDNQINLLVLYSHSIWRKYTSFLDSIPTYLMNKKYYSSEDKQTFTLALNFFKYSNLKETLEIHKSQMVWFRKLYMIFSRYMFLNDLSLLI